MSRKPDLADLRREIDALDDRILELLNDRARVAHRVGQLKRRAGAAAYAPGREEDLVRRLRERNPGPFPDRAIRPVWREIISASLSLEAPLTVAYLGPPATFTHQACQQRFGLSARYAPAGTISEVFEVVEKGKASYGVVPVENTTEGAVTHTLDMFVRSDLQIVAEVFLPVAHHLMNRSGRLEDVERVYSHPHALAQCRRWLEARLPGVPVLDAPSTAHAARLAAEEPRAAAVAGALAADLYGLETVEARIEDDARNVTRFLVIGPHRPAPSGRDKTSLLFAVRDEVGALYHMLRPFYDAGVNLTKIESRPLRGEAWQYVFFVDCEGHVTEPGLTRAVAELEGRCRFLRVIGSYPCAAPPHRDGPG